MTTKFLSDTASAFQLGQTVLAKVTNLDEEKRRFLVTLKMSEVISPDGDVETRLFNGVQERKAVSAMLASRGKNSSLFSFLIESLSPASNLLSSPFPSQRTVISTSSCLLWLWGRS